MTLGDHFKIFHVDRTLLLAQLRELESRYDTQLLPTEPESDREEDYYPQFPRALRDDARRMAQHYEIFYCLENFIRDLVVDTLVTAHGGSWWEQSSPSIVVPQNVKDNVGRNVQRERDAGITPRSSDLIDYTTFGELSVIIEANWEHFSDMFNSRKGLVSVLGRLNLLRGPIAHCSQLSEDEVVRLRLTLADWFRLMG